MRSGTIAFLLGIVTLQHAAALPDARWCLALPPVLLVIWRCPHLRLPSCFGAGVLWALWQAQGILDRHLPPALEGETITVTGTVAGLPETVDGRLRFDLDTETLTLAGQSLPGCGRVRLDWKGAQALHSGERWQLSVRLKRPHGMRNPGGFDYEGWLFQRRIRATGYALPHADNRRLQAAGWSADRVRESLRLRLRGAIGHHPLSGVVQALAIGARDGIGPQQWRVFFRTGTGHLIAISGLHIGLIAAFGFFLGRWLWSVPVYTLLYVPAPRAGAVASLLAAVAYAALAGFEVPTQRTVIMIAAMLAGLWLNRRIGALDSLLLALLAVLIVDPLAVVSVGFWLSFVAVAILLYSTAGRASRAGIWWQLGRTHLAIAIGLLPLSMLLFEQNPVLGPLANLVAVPWVSFVVVPLVLGGTFLLGVSGFLGYWLLSGALLALDLLWWLLERIAALDFAVWYQVSPGPVAAACAFVGAAILLMPRGLPSRWVGLVWLAPALLQQPGQPKTGELWFTLLDVGQGLAAVARTAHHTLVFDTGPAYSERFDTGAAVLVPYLRHDGVERVDRLIVSHGDNDHIGGARSLIEQMPVRQVLSSVPERLAYAGAQRCRDGQTWTWDGVEFTILHPPPGEVASDNDGSCVLRIRAGDSALLLPGDIEAPAEARLLAAHRDALRASILVAPHHGSRTSSTAAFVEAVAPRYVLYPAGYRNRYRHPHPVVRARYRGHRVTELLSAEEGAIRFRLGAQISAAESFRESNRRYWHDRWPR